MMTTVKKYLLLGSIVLLLIVNLINMRRIAVYKSGFNELSKASYSKYLSDSILIESLCDEICLASKNSNFKMSPNLKLTSEDGKQIILSDIAINKNMLIFRFNEFTCQDCIYKALGNIQELADEIGAANVLLLGAYKNQRYLFLNKRINNLKLPVYNVPLNALNNTIENYNVPYIFILDKDFNVQNLFIPNKEIPTLTKKYFQDILEKFKNK